VHLPRGGTEPGNSSLAAAQGLDLSLTASWVVGDSAVDVGLATAVGARPLHVGAQTFPDPDVTSLPDLATAVEFILNDNTGTSRPARRSRAPTPRRGGVGRDYAAELADAIGSIDVARISATDALSDAYQRDVAVFAWGNGGSASMPTTCSATTSRGAQRRVHLVVEQTLLGRAGTLRANRDFVIGENMFLAINADNLTDFDLGLLIDAHRTGGTVATLALLGRLIRRRSASLRSTMAWWSGSKRSQPIHVATSLTPYAFAPAVIDEIIGPEPQDIGFHLLPALVGGARAVALNGSYFIDIGTAEALHRACDDWERSN
jgi:hypothetical protein